LLNVGREELRDAVRALEERCVELEQERAAQHRQQQQQWQQSAEALRSLDDAMQRDTSNSTAAQQQAESKSDEATLKSRPDEEDDLDYEVIVDDLLQENEVSRYSKCLLCRQSRLINRSLDWAMLHSRVAAAALR
jgi:carboxypeptidase C (cathepsin A)